MPGDDDIERDIGKMLQRFKPDVRGAHPRAAHQLEVVRNAAVEAQAGIRIRWIDKLDGVIRDQETFVVEGFL